MNVCLSVCLYSMDSKTIHPITTKLCRVVVLAPGKVFNQKIKGSDAVFNFSVAAGGFIFLPFTIYI